MAEKACSMLITFKENDVAFQLSSVQRNGVKEPRTSGLKSIAVIMFHFYSVYKPRGM